MMFFGRKKREPGVWFDAKDPALFPEPGGPRFEERLVAGDMAAASYDPERERVNVRVAEGLGRYKDLRTPFYGHVREAVRAARAREGLGRATARELEGRAKGYAYYDEKARFKALARVQLAQPIPVEGRPGEFWWPPKELGRRPPVRGGTPEERQGRYDEEAERTARMLILLGQFRELLPFVDCETWLEEEGL